MSLTISQGPVHICTECNYLIQVVKYETQPIEFYRNNKRLLKIGFTCSNCNKFNKLHQVDHPDFITAFEKGYVSVDRDNFIKEDIAKSKKLYKKYNL